MFLDGWKKTRILGIWTQSQSDIIDMSAKRLFLVPEDSDIKLSKLYEKKVIFANVGKETINDLRVRIKSTYSKEYDSATDFVDFRIHADPVGMDVKFENSSYAGRDTYVELVADFINAGDTIEVGYLSSAEVDIEASGHIKEVEIVHQSSPSMLITKREKLADFLVNSHGIEILAGIIASAFSLAVFAVQ